MARLNLAEGAAVATPASGYSTLYVDTSGNWHQLNDAGTDAQLSVAGHTHATAGIDNAAVTNAKLANMAANTIKGRITASTGAPEDLTTANLLTLIKTVDGSGSGLDADLLDGYDASAFAAAVHTHTQLADSGWATLTVENTTKWDATSVVRYRKVGSLVYLRGIAKEKAGVLDADTGNWTFATLPSGYRPAQEHRQVVADPTTSTDGTVKIGTDGSIRVSTPSSSQAQQYYCDGVVFFID